jgi:fructokinase
MQKITSIGEILFDIYGNTKTLGGAPFNFIYHINKIMGGTNFISSVGNDNEGKLILDFMIDEGISTEYLIIDEINPTGKVIVKLNENKIPEYNIQTKVAYDFITLNEKQHNKIISESQLIYFGSLCQRHKTSRNTIQNFFNKGVTLFCDLNIRQNYFSKELIEESLNASNILKINEDELDLITKLSLIKSSGYRDNVKQIMQKYNIDLVGVTKGENGADLFSSEDFITNKSNRKKIIDTVGAGDAYSAILALGVLNNLDIERINILATSFAEEVCMQKGALLRNKNIYKIYAEEIKNG